MRFQLPEKSLDSLLRVCYNTGESMANDANRREGAKSPSLKSQIQDLQLEAVASAKSVRFLCEALLVEEEPLRRAKLLAIHAAMCNSGRGVGNHG